jgi:hypothetical protein
MEIEEVLSSTINLYLVPNTRPTKDSCQGFSPIINDNTPQLGGNYFAIPSLFGFFLLNNFIGFLLNNKIQIKNIGQLNILFKNRG